MRAFGLIGLLLALAIMGFLVKKRMNRAPVVNPQGAPKTQNDIPEHLRSVKSDRDLLRIRKQIESQAQKQLNERAKKAMEASGTD